jgi:hypothetical protein
VAFNGVSNELIADAPSARAVVRRLVGFIGADVVAEHVGVRFHGNPWHADFRRSEHRRFHGRTTRCPQ